MNQILNLRKKIDNSKIDIYFDKLLVVKKGIGAACSPIAMKRIFSRKEFEITINLKSGNKKAEIYTCDFSPDYVKINMV